MTETDLTTNWISVAASDALPEGEMLAVWPDGISLALYRVDGVVHCTSNICTHGDAQLTDGWLDGNIIECPLHGGCFNVCDGRGQGAPIRDDLRTYPTREIDGEILVEMAGGAQ
jgi:nitrite reductase/ring-hydroxylating ferredoxin subunit